MISDGWGGGGGLYKSSVQSLPRDSPSSLSALIITDLRSRSRKPTGVAAIWAVPPPVVSGHPTLSNHESRPPMPLIRGTGGTGMSPCVPRAPSLALPEGGREGPPTRPSSGGRELQEFVGGCRNHPAGPGLRWASPGDGLSADERISPVPPAPSDATSSSTCSGRAAWARSTSPSISGAAGFEKPCIVKTILPALMQGPAVPRPLPPRGQGAGAPGPLVHRPGVRHGRGRAAPTTWRWSTWPGVDLAYLAEQARAPEPGGPRAGGALLGQQHGRGRSATRTARRARTACRWASSTATSRRTT